MTLDPNSLSARALAARVRSGELSAQAVTRTVLDRIARINPRLNAIIQDCAETALAEAAGVDRQVAAGQNPGPLAGVPVTIKVLTDQVGYASTNGIRAQADLIATTDAPFLRNMRGAGAVVVGRTNTPAFSYRWFTSNALHGVTRNPHDAGLTPGGSSGGAGASVAAGLGHIAHGTDIAGSIRYPAYACGVQGLRPTPGRVPAFNASGPDRGVGPQIMAVSGPLARSVDDLRLGLEAMAGYDPQDVLSAPVPLVGAPVPKRAALLPRPGGMQTDPRILEDLERAAGFLRAAGWSVETPEAPDLREAHEIQIDLWLADEFEAKLAAAEAEGDAGALALLRHYADRARAVDLAHFAGLFPRRARLMRAWRAFVTDYPVVLMPVSERLPFANDADLGGDAAIAALWRAQLTQVALPVLGLPGLSVTSGVIDGVPSGVQVVAGPWREDVALEAGAVIEAGFGAPDPVD